MDVGFIQKMIFFAFLRLCVESFSRQSSTMIDKLCIVGVGLIGGSLARALRVAKVVRSVVGHGRNSGHLQRALKLGVIDSAETVLADAVRGADMVVLAVPVAAVSALLQEIAPRLDPSATITDVGSVKGTVVTAARAALGGRFPAFVPGHPIAGTEKSGIDASFAELYKGQRVVLTPEADTDADALKRVTDMWRATGAEILTMSATHHDEVLAATSHLPHMLAYTLVDALLKLDDRQTLFALAASSFRDVTRVASSDPEMWHDICLSNRAALVKALKHHRVQMDDLLAALERGDGDYLRALFTRAKQQRDALTAQDKGRPVE